VTFERLQNGHEAASQRRLREADLLRNFQCFLSAVKNVDFLTEGEKGVLDKQDLVWGELLVLVRVVVRDRTAICQIALL